MKDKKKTDKTALINAMFEEVERMLREAHTKQGAALSLLRKAILMKGKEGANNGK